MTDRLVSVLTDAGLQHALEASMWPDGTPMTPAERDLVKQEARRRYGVSDLPRDLEQAADGTRELSDAVLLALGWTVWDRSGERARPGFVTPDGKGVVAREDAPHPARSVDDGLALLAEMGGYLEMRGPRQYINIPSPVPNYCDAEICFGDAPPYKRVRAWAATPALALSAALVRARQAAHPSTSAQEKETA